MARLAELLDVDAPDFNVEQVVSRLATARTSSRATRHSEGYRCGWVGLGRYMVITCDNMIISWDVLGCVWNATP